jgi:hypothetical protein
LLQMQPAESSEEVPEEGGEHLSDLIMND